jgi:hypothetical protein
MIVDAALTRRRLEHLIDRKPIPFKCSEKVLKRFQKACEQEGFKNYSPVLEDLLNQFGERDEGNIKIPGFSNQSIERKTKTFSCSRKVFKGFVQACKDAGLRQVVVFEYLMDIYSGQIEKGQKSKGR